MRKVPRRIAGICGILGPIIAISAVLISVYLHPGFSWTDDYLSDLGELGTSYNFVFNLGLIAAGIALLLFVLGLPELVKRGMGQVGVVLIAVSMLSLVGIGAFPLGTSPHAAVSVTFFALPLIAFLLIGVDLVREPSERKWGAISLLAGVGLISLLPELLAAFLGVIGMAAIFEAAGAMVVFVWGIIFGVRLLQTPRLGG